MNNTPHFRALYELSGLTQREISEFLEVNIRTVERWCSTMSPPDGALADFMRFEDELAGFADEVIDSIDLQVEDRGEPFLVLIHAYADKESYEKSELFRSSGRTFGTQWEIVKRLYCILRGNDYPVRIVGNEDGSEDHITILWRSEEEDGVLESFTY